MGTLLPKEHENPRAFAAIHLPTIVGGFGLGLKEDLLKWVLKSPEPTQWLVSQLVANEFERKDLNIFKKLNSNTSSRGIASIFDYQEELIDDLYTLCEEIIADRSDGDSASEGLNPLTWFELRQRFPSDNSRRTIAEAENHKILSIEEFVKRATRGNLFQELLIGGEKLKVFNTNKYVTTYQKVVWPYWESQKEARNIKLPDDLTSVQIATAMNRAQRMLFINSEAPFLLMVKRDDSDESRMNALIFGDEDDGYDSKIGTLNKMHTMGLPNMVIPRSQLGVRL